MRRPLMGRSEEEEKEEIRPLFMYSTLSPVQIDAWCGGLVVSAFW